jgi:putative ABC transport system permease protein
VLRYNSQFYDVQIGYAGEDFFDIFSFGFIAGDASSVFTNPYEIIVTREFADKLTSGEIAYDDLLGHEVVFPLDYRDKPFKIVGVLNDLPKNSSINFEAVVSGKSGNNFGGCDNSFGYTSVFYQIKKNASAKDAEKNVNRFISEYYSSRVESMQNENMLVKTNDAFVPFVLPFKDVYLEGSISNCFEKSVNKRSFIILMTIGILILIVACSNYTILSLGQYLKKIGDVGIRKAIGAKASNIFAVFLAEGIILTTISFVLGSILCVLFIPVFGKLAQTEIFTGLINVRNVLLFSLVLLAGIVVFTSIIPVTVFSKVSPHQMGGGKIRVGNKSKLSQLFVSFQYSLSIILIIVTLFIVRQSNFLKNQSLGLDSNNIIDIRIDRLDDQQKKNFKTMASENPGIISLTQTSRNFMNGESDSYVNKGTGEQVDVVRFKVDHQYVPTLKLKLIHGNNFTERNVNNNDRSMIVNKKFAELFEIEDDPIGKTYRINGVNLSIIGVVDDYHFFDMKSEILPAMLFARTNFGNDYNNLLLRFQPQQLSSVIKHLEKCYAEVAPGKTLTYDFWNEKLRQRYPEEERWSRVIGYASAIAIIISSLGLFGLTILLINQRIKEIGIRKVNGAKASEVLKTINRSFISWLLGSLIIAIPVAYYIVNKWLSSFPYRVDMNWWIFIFAGSIALIVALITVSWQSWRAATRNPVEALRYE